MTPRSFKGTLGFVQGELTTRAYDRAIRVPNGKKSIDHVIQQLASSSKLTPFASLDYSVNSDHGDVAAAATEEEIPSYGAVKDCIRK